MLTKKLHMAKKTPLAAALLVFVKFFSPSALDRVALMPTPVPTPKAIMMV